MHVGPTYDLADNANQASSCIRPKDKLSTNVRVERILSRKPKKYFEICKHLASMCLRNQVGRKHFHRFDRGKRFSVRCDPKPLAPSNVMIWFRQHTCINLHTNAVILCTNRSSRMSLLIDSYVRCTDSTLFWRIWLIHTFNKHALYRISITIEYRRRKSIRFHSMRCMNAHSINECLCAFVFCTRLYVARVRSVGCFATRSWSEKRYNTLPRNNMLRAYCILYCI